MENCSKFGHFILRKIIENCCYQMSYFEAKMYQIRFRLGLRPRPCWGSLQRSPRPSTWNSGDLLLRGGQGKRGGKGRKGRVAGEEGKEKEGRGGGRGEGAPPKRKSCLRHWSRQGVSRNNPVRSHEPQLIAIISKFTSKVQRL